MGCDIHVMLERKRDINNIEKWVNIDYWQYKIVEWISLDLNRKI